MLPVICRLIRIHHILLFPYVLTMIVVLAAISVQDVYQLNYVGLAETEK